MLENKQTPSEHPPEKGLGNRRFDSLERLVAWSMRAGDYFIFCRVKSFREVTLPSGEKLDVPAAIACAWTDRDVEPDFESQQDGSSEKQSVPITLREYDTDAALQYNPARSFDETQGRRISEDPLGWEPGDINLFRYIQAIHDA